MTEPAFTGAAPGVVEGRQPAEAPVGRSEYVRDAMIVGVPCFVFACFALACFAGWVAQASLQQDFAAYWVAGAARRAGLDPYVNHVGSAAAPGLWDGVALFAHSRFLYPPIVAELLRPLAALPYAAAKVLFTALMAAAGLAAALVSARSVATPWARAAVVALAALGYPMLLALERGQVDPLVALLLVVASGARARPAVGGAALAAAVALKPGLAGVLLVVAALGRWRVLAAALAGLALVALACVVVSGPRLCRAYVAEVLPRAALFGEGGDASTLLPPERLAAHAADVEDGRATLDGRTYPVAAWDGSASASLPRLLAPEAPTPFAARAPAVVLFAALAAAAVGSRRRSAPARDALLLGAAAVAAVVASPAGWIMGLAVAAPLLAPWVARGAGTSAVARRALGVGLVALAVPPLVAGWAAVAGLLVVASAGRLAWTSPAGPT